jgi:hypothetical protein
MNSFLEDSSSQQIHCFDRNNVKLRQKSVKVIIVTHYDPRNIGRSQSMIGRWNDVLAPIARADFKRHERDGV